LGENAAREASRGVTRRHAGEGNAPLRPSVQQEALCIVVGGASAARVQRGERVLVLVCQGASIHHQMLPMTLGPTGESAQKKNTR